MICHFWPPRKRVMLPDERVLPTVTAFGKLIRTTAFRLTLVYLLLFALFAVSLLGYFAWNTRRLINEQIIANVSTEISQLSDMFAHRGLHGLVDFGGDIGDDLLVDQPARIP